MIMEVTSYTQACSLSLIFPNLPLSERRLRMSFHFSHFTKKTILRILREVQHLAQGHTARKWQTLKPRFYQLQNQYLFSYTRKSKVWGP